MCNFYEKYAVAEATLCGFYLFPSIPLNKSRRATGPVLVWPSFRFSTSTGSRQCCYKNLHVVIVYKYFIMLRHW